MHEHIVSNALSHIRTLTLNTVSDLIFRNPPLLQISTFSLGQKGCANYENVLIMRGHSILLTYYLPGHVSKVVYFYDVAN